ncbi:MAG TPA: multicopper oxidase family protein [Longimicrobiales bacterium]
MRSPLLAAALVLAAAPAGAQTCASLVMPDDPRVGIHGDPDLRCFELTAAPAARGRASGRVDMLHTAGPFTVNVTPDGEHVWRLRVTLDALPEPSAFDDDARVYVAWVTTPLLEPFVKLGAVAVGTQDVGDAFYDKFIVMISAEVADTVTERRGPLVLRGTSPSMRLQADHTPWLLSMATGPGAGGTAEATAGHTHAHAPRPGNDAARWPHPSMPDDIVMLSAMMPRLPTVSPYRPTHYGPHDFDRPRASEPVRRLLAAHTPDGTAFTFNGGLIGPTLRVRQGSAMTLELRNVTDQPMTIHWHGLRVANAFDGVAHHTQHPVQPGESFDYELTFPDAGLFWYHPHERADIAQDLGLYGNIIVDPVSADAPNAVNAELALMLDDVLLADDGTRMPHGREAATHALMGRFGDVLLINGDTAWQSKVSYGAVVRFLLTNAASTRTFNLTFGVDSVKLVGGDIGNYARERWVRSVPIGPAERYVVEVRYDGAGPFAIENRVHGIDHVMGRFLPRVDTIGTVHIDRNAVAAAPLRSYAELRAYDAVAREIDGFLRAHGERAVDRTLLLRMEADSLPFPLDRLMRLDSAYFHPVEWANTMPDMNWILSARDVRWILEDAATGARGHDIDWDFATGDVARIRIVNPRGSLHAMQHPIHLHGQRFLVLEQDGVRTTDHVWKDTVLVPVGSWIDVLVDFSNPGAWMLHCHIAEHMEAGMHTMVDVR